MNQSEPSFWSIPVDKLFAQSDDRNSSGREQVKDRPGRFEDEAIRGANKMNTNKNGMVNATENEDQYECDSFGSC